MSTFYFVDLKILPQNRNSHFKGESVTKERGKKSPKRKNQILDLMEEMAATENQLSLTLAPGSPVSTGNFVSLADHTYLEDKTSSRHKMARPLRPTQHFIKELI